MKSNCLLQAISNSIICKGHVYKVIPLKNKKGIPHFIWSDGDGYKRGYKHFTFLRKNKKRMIHWYNFLLFDGFVEDFPIEYLKTVKLKKIL
jgi:hypothetical protein